MVRRRRGRHDGSMSENKRGPQAPARPARDHRTAERVMKAILVVAALVAAIVVPFYALVIGVFVMAG